MKWGPQSQTRTILRDNPFEHLKVNIPSTDDRDHLLAIESLSVLQQGPNCQRG
jgi:hypothetical protein